MDHDWELIISILEILEIEVCDILQNPRNIGNLSFSTSSYPGNIGKRIFSTSSYPGNIGSYDPYSVLSWKYWKLKSSTLSISLEILEIWFFYFSHILEILEIWFFLIFWIFTKKTRAEISRRMVRFMCRDLSYETDLGPKTKTVSVPNFQVTPTTTTTTTRRQLSHLARPLDHHAQGPNIPFGVNPSLRQ